MHADAQIICRGLLCKVGLEFLSLIQDDAMHSA
jgi:hypothetical protein